ncbi:MAG: HlyD family secretion protein [bacterium]
MTTHRYKWFGLCLLLTIGACARHSGPAPHLGYVEADWLYISAPQAGWIVDMPVQEGDQAEAGRLLFQLDDPAQRAQLAELDAKIAQADAEIRNLMTGARPKEIQALQARLKEAKAHLTGLIEDRDRILPLVKEDMAPKAQLDQYNVEIVAAKAAVEGIQKDIAVAQQAGRPALREAAEAAKSSLEAARKGALYQLDQRQIAAPVNARIELIIHHKGEYVLPGVPILALLPDNALKVRFFVPQAELPSIEIGDSVQIYADGQTDPITAPISNIASEAEYTPPVIYSEKVRAKLVFRVEADLPYPSPLKPGLPVEVRW